MRPYIEALRTRPELKPLGRYPQVAVLSAVLLFITDLLLLLVSLSLPIIKTIYLVRLRSTASSSAPSSTASEIRFGVWGLCATGDIDPATWYGNPGLCYGPRMGYDVPDYLAGAINVPPQVIQVVQKALTAVLVLHPIAAAFATVSFLASVFLASHAFAIFALVLSIVTALLTSLAFAIDVAIVAVAHVQLLKLSALHFDVFYGNAVWMILVAVATSWASVISLSARSCFCLGVQRHPDDSGRFLKPQTEQS